jgi:hypothetical protein
MSRGQDDFDEHLRRALHEAADRVQPTHGGLDRIRRSLTRPRPVLLAAVMAAWATAVQWASSGLQTLMAWLRTVFGATPESQQGAPKGSRRPWAGTALAALLAAAVAVAGVFALTPALRQSLPGMAVRSRSLPGGGVAGSNAPKVNGHGGQLTPGSAAGTGPHRPPEWASAGAPCPATTPAPSPSATPAVSPGQAACTSLPTSPGPSASASPSASPSQSASPSPSPSPSPSASPSPSESPPPSESPSPSPPAPSVPIADPSPSVTAPPPAGSPAYQGIFVKKTLTNSWPSRVKGQIRPGKRSRHGHDGGLKPWQSHRHHQGWRRHLAEGTNRLHGLGPAISRLARPRVHHAPHGRR